MHPLVFVLLCSVLQLLALNFGRRSHPIYGPIVGIVFGFIVFVMTIAAGLLIYTN